VAQPLVGGIYAADPEQLSLAATMPRFLEMERDRGSVIRSMWSEQRRRSRRRETGSGARWSLFVTLTDGMQKLVDTIAQQLPENSIRRSAPAKTLSWDAAARQWNVKTRMGESFEADAVIVAVPALYAAPLFRGVADTAMDELAEVRYASTATVTLAFRREDFPRAPDSFGFVVPAIERRKIMACTFSSLKYPGRAPEDHVLLRAFVGGALQPEYFHADDATMEQNVRDELARLLGLTAKPILSRIWRHPNSMPQYHVGHETRVQRIEAALSAFPTLALAGSAYHGVGIADCVRTGEEAAKKVVAAL
jgi:oxygen-dependent protoporphyrinogen oxidase